MPTGIFPQILSQQILAGMILVGRVGVPMPTPKEDLETCTRLPHSLLDCLGRAHGYE